MSCQKSFQQKDVVSCQRSRTVEQWQNSEALNSGRTLKRTPTNERTEAPVPNSERRFHTRAVNHSPLMQSELLYIDSPFLQISSESILKRAGNEREAWSR